MLLAIVTFWLVLEARSERKELVGQRRFERGRTLWDAIYSAVLREVEDWLHPDQTFTKWVLYKSAKGSDFRSWPTFKAERSHLFYSVPREIANLLDEAEQAHKSLSDAAGDLEARVRNEFEVEVARICSSQGGTSNPPTRIVLEFADGRSEELDTFSAWVQLFLNDVGLFEYARSIASLWRQDKWDLKLRQDRNMVGNAQNAVTALENVLKTLGQNPLAIQYKKSVPQVRGLAEKVKATLEKESRGTFEPR